MTAVQHSFGRIVMFVGLLILKSLLFTPSDKLWINNDAIAYNNYYTN